MDWTALQATAKNVGDDDVATLKANLPIPYVLERAGHPLATYDGERAQTKCPFHTDSSPSFDVYGETLERWGCFPCGLNGDVLDLVRRLYGNDATPFPQVVEWAKALVVEKDEAGWKGPTTGVKREFDWEAARALVTSSRTVDPLPVIREFLDSKVSTSPGLGDLTAEWLRDEFRLGSKGPEVIIPYLDRDGEVVSYKHRTAETKALSPSGGGQFDDVLYGEWRDTDPTKPVLLCEGESDVWVASAALPGFAVLGLPTGAGAHPKQAGRLARRKVVIALDGDPAGRAAVVKWYAALLKEECEVRLVPMPDGLDLASMTVEQVKVIVARARPVPAVPSGIAFTSEGYHRPGKEINTPLTNWTFDPVRELRGDGGCAYEGFVRPGGDKAVLSSYDLGTKSRIVGWSTRHGGSWYGADRDGQLLLGLLQAQGPFLATGTMATTAGLHNGQFVWPGGRIGTDHLVYVPPATDIHLEERMNVVPGDWSPQQVLVLRELHQHRVTDPMLAWMAAAPLRSLLREFPVMAVTGSSGSGKTTLLETMLHHFTGTLITNNLTATTKHAVFAFVGATNGFPVWFDEYRPGARKDAIETLNQLIRDAYTGQSSSKGGMGEQWAEVTSVSTSAPLIVSGEDAFSETSHTERMALVTLPLAGKNADTLARVKEWGPHGLAYNYLAWLYAGLQEGWLPVMRNFEAGPEDLPTRQRLNLGVLHIGWALLSQFLRTFGDDDLGEPDFSLVIEEGQESAKHNPIQDALLWALDEYDASDFITNIGGTVSIRVENFVQYVTNRSSFTLPGGSKAVASFLANHYDAKYGEGIFTGQKKACMVMSHARVLQSAA